MLFHVNNTTLLLFVSTGVIQMKLLFKEPSHTHKLSTLPQMDFST